MLFVNIACGDTYVAGWRNLDYAPHSRLVQRANLLERLPFNDSEADVVYSSHFFEHIPRARVDSFCAECFRIIKPGGRIRLVMPDLEEMCRTYLDLRTQGEHARADFVVLEMLDQCVRTVPGGELREFYAHLDPGTGDGIIDFVEQRNGHVVSSGSRTRGSRLGRAIVNPKMFLGKLEELYVNVVLAFLPKAFREQNVSRASIGERHAWIYDFESLRGRLIDAGFTDVRRMTAATSAIQGFPCDPLDVASDGKPRKGAESMYIEARKP